MQDAASQLGVTACRNLLPISHMSILQKGSRMTHISNPKQSFGLVGDVFRCLKRVLCLTDEQRRYRDIFLNDFTFDDSGSYEDQYDQAVEFYKALLRGEGFDPARSPLDIENAVKSSYNTQFRVYDAVVQQYAQARALARAQQAAKPVRGSDDHIRQEAQKTFEATGVYGLPNAGGYILTKAERARLGLIY